MRIKISFAVADINSMFPALAPPCPADLDPFPISSFAFKQSNPTYFINWAEECLSHIQPLSMQIRLIFYVLNFSL